MQPEKLVLISLVGILLLNVPLLSLYDQKGLVAGIPIFYLSIFCIWFFLIVLLAIVIHKSDSEES